MRAFFNIFIFIFIGLNIKCQNWIGFGNKLSPYVTALYVRPSDNKLYIGGQFTNLEGKGIRGIATYDGLKFDSVGCGVGIFTDGIWRITEYNSQIYVAGSFGTMGNLQTNGLAKWNGLKWDSVGNRINGLAFALKEFNNDLYVGGFFWKIGNQNIRAVAKWDGANWSILGSGFPYNWANSVPTINAIEVFNNEIYVGGTFEDSTGNVLAVAKWNGIYWSKGNLKLYGMAPSVNDLKVYNGNLYVAGRFYEVDGNVGNCIVKYDGIKWSRVGDAIKTSNGYIKRMEVINNKLYVVGGFYNIQDNIAAHSIAIWNDTVWCAPPTGSQQYQSACLALFKDTIYMGGGFYDIGNDTVPALAKLITSNQTCSSPVGIKEHLFKTNIKIFPNPVNDNLNIISEQEFEKGTVIDVINALGQTVLKTHYSNQIDVTSLSVGYYLLKLSHPNNQSCYYKFIKQ